MTEQEIYAKLKELVRRELSRELPDLHARLSDHFESIELITLAVAVEDGFEVILEADDETQIQTMADLAAVIDKKISQRRSWKP